MPPRCPPGTALELEDPVWGRGLGRTRFRPQPAPSNLGRSEPTHLRRPEDAAAGGRRGGSRGTGQRDRTRQLGAAGDGGAGGGRGRARQEGVRGTEEPEDAGPDAEGRRLGP